MRHYLWYGESMSMSAEGLDPTHTSSSFSLTNFPVQETGTLMHGTRLGMTDRRYSMATHRCRGQLDPENLGHLRGNLRENSEEISERISEGISGILRLDTAST